MLHQVLFSGYVKKEQSPIVGPLQAQRIFELAKKLNYSGLSIYLDGSFMTLYEGDLATIEATFDFYASLPAYNHVLRLIERPIAQRDFEGFALGLRDIDCQGVFGVVPNCFSLNTTNLETILPENFPNEYKILMRTFSRVNNTHALQAI